jgi:hypothetical protein
MGCTFTNTNNTLSGVTSSKVKVASTFASTGNGSSKDDPPSDVTSTKSAGISNQLDLADISPQPYNPMTHVLELNELLVEILSHLPSEELSVARLVSKALCKVARKVGFQMVSLVPSEDRDHHFPTPHYPACVPISIHPMFDKTVIKPVYARRNDGKKQPDVVLHVLHVEDSKPLMLSRLRDDMFITSPPITKLEIIEKTAGGRIACTMTGLTVLRVPSGIKFKHLLEFYQAKGWVTAANISRTGFPIYAFYMVCSNCEAHIEVPEGYKCDSNDATEREEEALKVRSKLARSAQQCGTMQERFLRYQQSREELCGNKGCTKSKADKMRVKQEFADMANKFHLFRQTKTKYVYGGGPTRR